MEESPAPDARTPEPGPSDTQIAGSGIADLNAADLRLGQLRLGLFGKHPARGDFIEAGLGPVLLPGLEQWLDAALTTCRTTLGPAWEQVWDAAAPRAICFWMGEGLAGEVVAGVLRPSHDKVGRRYPLLVLAAGPAGLAPPPPVLGAPDAWMMPLTGLLEDILQRRDFETTAALLADATAPVLAQDGLAGPSEVLALREDGDLARLFDDACAADHRRSAAGRSYWWQAGVHGARFFAGAGLPDGRILAWFLGSGAKES